MILYISLTSCSNNVAFDDIEETKDELHPRSVLFELFAGASELSDIPFIVKKYETTFGSEIPNTTVSVRMSNIGNYFMFGNTSVNVVNGFGSKYYTPSHYSLVQSINSLVAGQMTFNFTEIVPINFNSFSFERIGPGANITWNSSNQTGIGNVMLIIRPDYISMNQEPLPSFDNKIIFTEDDGSYAISSIDLSDFPSGLPLTLTIVRGSYSIFSSTSSNNCVLGTVSLSHSPTFPKI